MVDPNERGVPEGYELDMYESREWRVRLHAMTKEQADA